MTLDELIAAAMHGARIEPVRRVKCLHHVPRGQRGEPELPRYIWHKYPIRGGITGQEVLAESVMKRNALFQALSEKIRPSPGAPGL